MENVIASGAALGAVVSLIPALTGGGGGRLQPGFAFVAGRIATGMVAKVALAA